MRSAVLSAAGQPLEIVDRAVPEPGPGEVLVKVTACGMCYSEVNHLRGNYPFGRYPTVPGHEISGVVAALGEGVDWPAVGTPVGTGWIHGSCGHCDYCARGDQILCTGAPKQITGVSTDGGYADLNVYIAGLGSGLLGYATFPGEELALDGLVLLNESLPGGSAAPYNLGDTATHEIGHWLGLFHTFEGGCSEPGDFVSDTPAQLDGDNIFFCNESDDTCPKPGLDPVHNFMSYGDDFCLDRFTEGQNRRQIATWLGQRAGR